MSRAYSVHREACCRARREQEPVQEIGRFDTAHIAVFNKIR